jgi:2-keto-4-pentenoate hydratase/2-oxohepta-3-ene-1,7-dioic acid hydratase in catechol pathway
VKLITFIETGSSESRIGVLSDAERFVDLAAIPEAPFDTHSMIALIEGGERALEWVGSMLRSGRTRALADVRLLAPIPRPRKNVFCVGWNYLEHFKEGEKGRAAPVDLPDHPVFFTKAPTAVTGPYEAIRIARSVTAKLDWEVELGVVIGRAGRNIPESKAMSHVWGYTVINDVTGRDVQRQHGQQWFKGKSLDFSCPMGPALTTADECDPDTLDLSCRVNGAVKQRSNTSFMYFKIPRLIAELSHGLTLEPGDVIATGTPQGVGHARNPPEFLEDGDVLETEVAGLGVLRNRIER